MLPLIGNAHEMNQIVKSYSRLDWRRCLWSQDADGVSKQTLECLAVSLVNHVDYI